MEQELAALDPSLNKSIFVHGMPSVLFLCKLAWVLAPLLIVRVHVVGSQPVKMSVTVKIMSFGPIQMALKAPLEVCRCHLYIAVTSVICVPREGAVQACVGMVRVFQKEPRSSH